MNSFSSFKTKAGDKDFWHVQRNCFLLRPWENFLCYTNDDFFHLWNYNREFKKELIQLARAWVLDNKLNPDTIVGDGTLFFCNEIPRTIPGYRANRLTDRHKRKIRLMFMEWAISKFTDNTPKVLNTEAKSKMFWQELYSAFIKSEHNLFCPSYPVFNQLWKNSDEFKDEVCDLVEGFSNHTFGSRYIFPRNKSILFPSQNLYIVLRVFPDLSYKPKIVRIAFLEWVINKLS